MSTTIDNITLVLLSLKEALSTYLDDNKWRDQYKIFIGGDPILRNKELVEKVTDKRIQIPLPVIIIDAPIVRPTTLELGNVSGTDVLEITVIVLALDSNQLRTLGNTLRRKIDNLVFDIYNYSDGLHTDVGDGVLFDASYTDLSDWSAEVISERYNAIINVSMNVDSESLI